MMRIVKATLLTCAVAAVPSVLFAQAAAAPAAGGQCQMPDAEYQVYNNANTQTDPKAKAAALEAYLTQFPNSCAKLGALGDLITAYGAIPDNAKAIGAADRVLQLDPSNPQAIFYEAFLHLATATAINDPDPKKAAAAKLPELDQAANYAQKGLALGKPASMTDANFATYKQAGYPTFYSAIGFDDFNKGDFAGAVDTYKKEIAFVQADPKLAPQLNTPNQVLQDIYWLAAAYYQLTPPDFLNCAFYGAHVVGNVPDAMKAQYNTVPQFCYKQYHGKIDAGYDQLVQLATKSITPPADLATTITPKPTPAQIIADILKTTTPDQLATADKEYILQNGTPDQVETVWNSMKGKSFQFPDMVVVSATPQQIQVASPAAVVPGQTPTADLTFNMAAPEELPAKATPAQKAAFQKKQDAIAEATQPGKTVTLAGTFDSFTPKPFMITLTDGQVILPTAAKKPAAAAHAPAAHRAPARKAK